MKIVIAVPCMDQVAAPFAQSLATIKKVGECEIVMMIGSLVYDSRNKIATHAVKAGADAVLWLDSDMIFPADTLEKMIHHLEEGKEIVSGIYFRRRTPFTPVIYEKLEKSGESKDYLDYPKDSVFKVEGAGFGVVMTSGAVLQDMVINGMTWFEPMNGLGEDLSFCMRARELGYEIWCDSTIKCGHIGQLVVDEKIWETMR